MKRLILLSAFLIATTGFVQAQIEIGVKAIPSISTFHVEDVSDKGSYTYPFNFGIGVNYHHQKFVFATGLLHLTQGEKFQFMQTTVANPQGTGELFDVFFRTKAIVVPLSVDYHFFKCSGSSFFGGLGIYTGVIYSQEQENTIIPESSSYPKRFIDMDLFNNLYLGVNVGIGWRYELSEQINMQLRPNFLYQIRQDQDDITWTHRMMAWGLDIGVYYQFGRN